MERGNYKIVYATPEILLSAGSGSYFYRTILKDPTHPFLSKLSMVAFDEAHVVKSWSFRIYYQLIGALRDCLPKHVVMAGFSATMTPTNRSYFSTTARLQRPILHKESIRRDNLTIMVAPICGTGYKDLAILIAENIQNPSDILITLVFIDNILEVIYIAWYLRSLLSEHLRHRAQEIIRCFFAAVDPESKASRMADLKSGKIGILVCTDACGMGVHCAIILRVVQWKLTERLKIDNLYQRIGRGGRDMATQALGLIFVSTVHLLLKIKDKSSGEVDLAVTDEGIIVPRKLTAVMAIPK
jgi:superfamily II DNA helicase RecQ